MSEIKIFYKDKEKIKVARTISALKELDKKDIIWIDLLDVSDKTEDTLEGFLKIDIQEDEEMEEIELSSRYIQTDDSIVANSNFLKNNYEVEPVNFILKNSILVTIRDVELDSFNETIKKMFVNTRNFPSGYHVLVALFETRVEKDADMIEDTTDMITTLSQQINAKSDHVDEDLLVQIKDLQEKVTIIRQNIMDKQRVISNFLKCDFFPEELGSYFMLINSYTTGLSASTMKYIAELRLGNNRKMNCEADELGLPVGEGGLALPCGSSVRVEFI